MKTPGACHLVGEDAIDAVVEEVDEPVESVQLILAHGPSLDDAGLLSQAVAHMLPLLILQQLRVLLFLCVLCSVPPLLFGTPASYAEKYSEEDRTTQLSAEKVGYQSSTM